MANLRTVNREIRKSHPEACIEIVRGCGYFYFVGDELIPSIMANPASTSTKDLAEMALQEIGAHFNNKSIKGSKKWKSTQF